MSLTIDSTSEPEIFSSVPEEGVISHRRESHDRREHDQPRTGRPPLEPRIVPKHLVERVHVEGGGDEREPQPARRGIDAGQPLDVSAGLQRRRMPSGVRNLGLEETGWIGLDGDLTDPDRHVPGLAVVDRVQRAAGKGPLLARLGGGSTTAVLAAGREKRAHQQPTDSTDQPTTDAAGRAGHRAREVQGRCWRGPLGNSTTYAGAARRVPLNSEGRG